MGGQGRRVADALPDASTDPDRLEALLGIRHSKGCVRIPASLNTFFDQHGLLDDDYQARVEAGKSLWVLRRDRDITPIAGRSS